MHTVDEIKAHLTYGDWNKIAKLTGLTVDNAWVAFRRAKSKHHKKVVREAKKVALFNQKHGF